MKRVLAKLAAQGGMFVFVVVLASVLHPVLSKHNSNLVWALAFLVVLGLLLLPGWLFKRFWPVKPKIVRIHKSVPLPGGGTLYVSSTGIGPIDGFKGFRTTAVYDPEAAPPRSKGRKGKA